MKVEVFLWKSEWPQAQKLTALELSKLKIKRKSQSKKIFYHESGRSCGICSSEDFWFLNEASENNFELEKMLSHMQGASEKTLTNC